jgi:hypothetical protein
MAEHILKAFEPQQVSRSGTEDQESAGTPPFVNQAAKQRKQVGTALYLVETNQLAPLRLQKKLRFRCPTANAVGISNRLQV